MQSPVWIYKIKHIVFDLNQYKLSNEKQCGSVCQEEMLVLICFIPSFDTALLHLLFYKKNM